MRLFLTAVLLGAALAGAGCERDPGGAVRVTVIGEKPALTDPAAGPLEPADAVLVSSVAQGLVRFDARGQIVPGLAERWNVTDDGLSYIFRLAAADWPRGERITAHQVARTLRRHIAPGSKNPLRDTMGAVAEIVAMTDRVIEIRLRAPRPNLLQILAQPQFAVVRSGVGGGPFRIDADDQPQGGPDSAALPIRLERDVALADEDAPQQEIVELRAAEAEIAVASFIRRETDLVLGGGFAELPRARIAAVPNGALRFDPAIGLFGLVPARPSGPIADPDVRRLLSEAIDRDALIAALGVPGLLPRATVLEPGLDGIGALAAPAWLAVPIAERRQMLAESAQRLFGAGIERPTLRIALPEGPGSDILLTRLRSDWSVLGVGVERAEGERSADLILVDRVAPSTSPAWYLRQFRCGIVAVCSEETDALLESARAASVLPQRAALLLEAARTIDDAQLFLPIAAPIRWSLVAPGLIGFSGNRFAVHPLSDLRQRLNPERGE